MHSITDETAPVPLLHNNKSLSSGFNFSALIGTLLSFPGLQGIEVVPVGLGGAQPVKQSPSLEGKLQSDFGVSSLKRRGVGSFAGFSAGRKFIHGLVSFLIELCAKPVH